MERNIPITPAEELLSNVLIGVGFVERVAIIETNQQNTNKLLGELRDELRIRTPHDAYQCRDHGQRIIKLETWRDRIIGALLILQVEAATFIGLVSAGIIHVSH